VETRLKMALRAHLEEMKPGCGTGKMFGFGVFKV